MMKTNVRLRRAYRIGLCMLLLLLIAYPFPGCGSKSSSTSGSDSTAAASAASGDSSAAGAADTDEEGEASKKQRERTTSVDCARAELGDLVLPIIAEGTVRARHSAEIRFEVEGRLDRILIDEGREVAKGRLLALIDAREYEVAVEEARARYFEALSRMAVEEDSLDVQELSASLKQQFDDLAALEKKGAITREERLGREIALDVQALKEGHYRIDIIASRNGVAAARTALERARLDLERTQIRAPFTGVISGLTLSAGEQITRGQTFATLVNSSDIEADVGVLEADMAHLAVGSPALLAVPSVGETLDVRVDVISPHFNRETRTCQVLLRFQSPGGAIRPGMFVRAIIAGDRHADRLLVPNEAILSRDGRPLLFKVENGRTQWLYVDLGERNDQVVEIKQVVQGGTLAPGDLVVVSDHLTLSHNAKVKVKNTVSPRDPWRSYRDAGAAGLHEGN